MAVCCWVASWGRYWAPPWPSYLVVMVIFHHLVTTSVVTEAARATHVRPETFYFTEPVYNATIPENSVGKVYVVPRVKMGMYISDPSLSVRYRIISGDANKLFKADDRTVGNFCFLTIRTRTGNHEVINRERKDEYKLIVKAIARYKNAPRLTAQTEVTVTVLDANDLSPLFDLYPDTSYTVEVPEDTPVYETVMQVSASDADTGVNGDVYYSFGQKTETFAIHPTSGAVYLTRPLSYIDQNSYVFDVLARDRGPRVGRGRHMSKAELKIRVIEVNFHAPTIKIQNLPAVVEHGKIGTIYAILYVHDKDFGNMGKKKKVPTATLR